jgi:site-specific recombinase XerD
MQEGIVSFRKKYRSSYNFRWTDPITGDRIDQSYKITDVRVARKKARELSDAVEGGYYKDLETVKANITITFGEVGCEYFDGCSLSQGSKKSDIGRFNIICEDWGDTLISGITSGDIQHYLSKTKNKRNWTSSTRNKYLSVIRQIFKFGVSVNYLVRNTSIEVTKTKEENKIPDALTEPQFLAVMRLLPEHVRIIIGILHDTGLRKSELGRLVRRDLSFSKRIIYVRKTKSKAARIIPMTDWVYDILRKVSGGMSFNLKKNSTPYLLVWPPLTDAQQLVIPGKLLGHNSSGLRWHLEKTAKLLCPNDTEAYERIPDDERLDEPRLGLHQMRHTYATFLGANGATDLDLMDLGGWTSIEMVRRYRKVVDQRLHDVMKVFNKPVLKVIESDP